MEAIVESPIVSSGGMDAVVEAAIMAAAADCGLEGLGTDASGCAGCAEGLALSLDVTAG